MNKRTQKPLSAIDEAALAALHEISRRAVLARMLFLALGGRSAVAHHLDALSRGHDVRRRDTRTLRELRLTMTRIKDQLGHHPERRKQELLTVAGIIAANVTEILGAACSEDVYGGLERVHISAASLAARNVGTLSQGYREAFAQEVIDFCDRLEAFCLEQLLQNERK